MDFGDTSVAPLPVPGTPAPDFLEGGGELGAALRAFDWSASPLGVPHDWSHGLKICVRIILSAHQPMSIWWGEAKIHLYNDAYKDIIGIKHPAALGQPCARTEGAYGEALQVLMDHDGHREETYYTCSYTPILGEDGAVDGVLCAFTDDTNKIIGERRLALLRDLATRTWDAPTMREALTLSTACLQGDPQDIPFALIFTLDSEKYVATLAAKCGIEDDHAAAQATSGFDDPDFWPIGRCASQSAPLLLEDLALRFGPLPKGAWDRPPGQAVLLPIVARGQSAASAVLIVGCNPYQPYDEAYQNFLILIARQIAATIAHTQAYGNEVKRAQAVLELDRTRSAFCDSQRAHAATLETLNHVGQIISSDLDIDRVAQSATDAATKLCGAAFGAFFYHTAKERGAPGMGCALSNITPTAFSRVLAQRDIAIFEAVPENARAMRSDDIAQDPRFAIAPVQSGVPAHHMQPIRSYLAVPVISRLGEMLGNMYFGHGARAAFTEDAEKLVCAIASQAATAIDNARLFQAVQRELARRHEIEKHQKLLLNELNHRVNNTLATVQAIAMQTLRGTDHDERERFLARLFALSAQHTLLTEDNWEGAKLKDVVLSAVRPFVTRCSVDGPDIHLPPKRALALGMAFHELTRNAAQHGALSSSTGTISVSWQLILDNRLTLRWKEFGGPQVTLPTHTGFGRRLIETGLAHEFSARIRLEFPPDGVMCEWEIPPHSG